ncbi:MAG: pilus assembly protein TadG-related protein [Nocardioides sp.]|nr:pilus assembly protein TadG-related protein [Nocardioides sp.]
MRAARREDGAAAMMTAILMVVIVGMTSFAVDLGMQRVVRSDMQALADVVALDTARLIDGRNAGQIRSGAGGPMSLDQARKRSLQRNQDGLGTVDDGDVTAELVFVDAGPLGQVEPRRLVSGALEPVPDGEVPHGVWVSAAGEVQFAFRAGSGGAQRSAMAQAQSVACFRLGSVTAGLSSEESKLLNAVLGNALKVSSVGYDGLVGAQVSLAGLAAELGVGTAEALVGMTGVKVGDLYLAMARALQKEGGEVADVTILQSIAAKVSSDLRVNMDDLLNLSTGGAAGLAAEIDALDLVMASAFAANGTNALKTGVIWNEPAISKGEVMLSVVEVPQPGCGPAGSAKASTGQFQLATTIPFQPGAKVAGLNVKEDIVLGINVDVGRADGTLTRIQCGDPSATNPDEIEVDVTRTPMSAALDGTLKLTGTLSSSELTSGLEALLLRLGILDVLYWLLGSSPYIELDIVVDLGAMAASAGSSASVPVSNPALPYTVVGSTGGAAVALPTPLVDSADVTGTFTLRKGDRSVTLAKTDVKLGPILTSITNDVVNKSLVGLVKNVNDVIMPLSEILGLSLTSADVFALPRPACGVPALVR